MSLHGQSVQSVRFITERKKKEEKKNLTRPDLVQGAHAGVKGPIGSMIICIYYVKVLTQLISV